jgi:hypothetical protein
MAQVDISTDGSINGTTLSVDGKDVTKKEKVISIQMYAAAPYRSSYSGDLMVGYATVSYEIAGDDGKIERKEYGTTNVNYTNGIGQKIKTSDAVVRFIGQESDREITDLVDKIVTHCAETKISCPTRDTLLSRTLESLKDKAKDLGIQLEDQGNE